MDMDRKNMLERVVKAARKAYMKGFAAGSGGNVSIRIQGQVYISPSGICLGDLTQEDMIMLEADGFATPADKPDSGRRRPSKEAGMHLACYRSRPDILCLFHLHSPYSIAAACRRQGNGSPATGMPAYTPGYAMRVGRIPVVPYYLPGSRELAEAVSDVICSRDSLLLANHGMVAAGKARRQCWPLRRRLRRMRILPYFWETGEFPLMKNRQRRCFGQEELYDA